MTHLNNIELNHGISNALMVGVTNDLTRSYLYDSTFNRFSFNGLYVQLNNGYINACGSITGHDRRIIFN